MKRALVLLLASASLAAAESIRFEIENGLSPVLPPPDGVSSSGSGGDIESGIWFETDTATLTFVIGYGSAAGFTDLTGPAVGAQIQNASAGIFDLWGQHFMNSDPSRGGILRGVVDYRELADEEATRVAVEELLAGQQSVNILTQAYPAGEIRGFLVPVGNQAPLVLCNEDVVTECVSELGTEVALTARVSDPDGDALRVVWAVDGEDTQTQEIPAGMPHAVTEVEFAAIYLTGAHSVTVTVFDAEASSSCQSWVTVEDTTPPVITRVTTGRRMLWPANHKMVPVRVQVAVEDCSPVTWRVVEVSSNEPVNGKGDGNTSPDWEIVDEHNVHLRAERAGGGHGRIYTVRIRCTDASGLSSEATTEVKVPHSMDVRFRSLMAPRILR